MFGMVPYRRNNLTGRDDFFSPFFSDFFDDDIFPWAANMGAGFRVDLKENDDSYLVEADLPGVKKDAISIEYNNNQLTISAKREDSMEARHENFIRRERRYGEFRRSFYIDNVDENKIDASFSEGVLRIVLPKLNKGRNRIRKINIR